MFRVLVNGLFIGQRRFFGDARILAKNAKRNYTNNPIVTIEDRIGWVIEIVK